MWFIKWKKKFYDDIFFPYLEKNKIDKIKPDLIFSTMNDNKIDSLLSRVNNSKKIKSGEYDNFTYRYGEITWSLESIETNNNNVLKLIRQFPSIQFFFNNPGEFIDSPNENLTAGLNELFYPDGTAYPEGAKYHIHPEKGPMEGAFHISEPHSLLSFDRPQIEENEPIQYTPSFSSPRPSFSGGGGGGY